VLIWRIVNQDIKVFRFLGYNRKNFCDFRVQSEIVKTNPRLIPRSALNIWALMNDAYLFEVIVTLFDKALVAYMISSLDIISQSYVKLPDRFADC
jgi:hypothetical protein